MDNKAFQKMVRGRRGADGPSSASASTKEIARAAVEEEFRKRRRRPGKKRKHGVVGSDDYSSESDKDDDDNNNDDRRQRPKKESALLIRPTQVKGVRVAAGANEETEEASDKYRDRAKERRERGGAPSLIATVESSSSALAEDDADAMLPLPVGGMSGLDLNLVRKEREQLQRKGGDANNGNDLTLEFKRSDADPAAGSSSSWQTLPSLDQARRSLEQFVADPASSISLPTELSEYVIQYAATALSFKEETINREKILCGVEGRTLQRTRLVMSMDAHPSDRRRAWEIPREVLNQNAQEYPVIPLLSEEMLESMQRFFSAPNKKTISPSGSLFGTTTLDVLGQANSTSPTKGDEDATQAKSSQRNTVETRPHSNVNDDNDDDDIFGGLDDYVPPQAKI